MQLLITESYILHHSNWFESVTNFLVSLMISMFVVSSTLPDVCMLFCNSYAEIQDFNADPYSGIFYDLF